MRFTITRRRQCRQGTRYKAPCSSRRSLVALHPARRDRDRPGQQRRTDLPCKEAGMLGSPAPGGTCRHGGIGGSGPAPTPPRAAGASHTPLLHSMITAGPKACLSLGRITTMPARLRPPASRRRSRAAGLLKAAGLPRVASLSRMWFGGRASLRREDAGFVSCRSSSFGGTQSRRHARGSCVGLMPTPNTVQMHSRWPLSNGTLQWASQRPSQNAAIAVCIPAPTFCWMTHVTTYLKRLL